MGFYLKLDAASSGRSVLDLVLVGTTPLRAGARSSVALCMGRLYAVSMVICCHGTESGLPPSHGYSVVSFPDETRYFVTTVTHFLQKRCSRLLLLLFPPPSVSRDSLTLLPANLLWYCLLMTVLA